MQEFLCETEKLLPMTDIISILKLSNLNSVKLYAIARRFEKIGEFIFTIDWIKKFLWVGTDEYMSYARFKIDIFEPSIKEIYESTGLIIIYDEVVDTNSNVLELRFSISRKNTVSIAN